MEYQASNASPAERAAFLTQKTNDVAALISKALSPIQRNPQEYNEQFARGVVAQLLQIAQNLEDFIDETSGQIPPPANAAIERAIWDELARLPERYFPIALTHEVRGYRLRIDNSPIYEEVSAAEALERTKRYIAEHERADFEMPAAIVNGRHRLG